MEYLNIELKNCISGVAASRSPYLYIELRVLCARNGSSKC
jgi:hypothetical protein